MQRRGMASGDAGLASVELPSPSLLFFNIKATCFYVHRGCAVARTSLVQPVPRRRIENQSCYGSGLFDGDAGVSNVMHRVDANRLRLRYGQGAPSHTQALQLWL